MNRWSVYGKSDTELRIDNDPGFVGINMLNDPSMLQPGFLRISENRRMQNGVCVGRRGTGYPGDFNPVFEDVIIGSGIFSDPNGNERMMVATKGADYVWALQYGKDPKQIDANVLLDGVGVGEVEFVQSFDKCLLLRKPFAGTAGLDDPGNKILVWDGDDTHDFEIMTLIPPALNLVRATWDAEPFANRIIYYNAYWNAAPGRDRLTISEVNNYTGYDNILGVFRINAGESDAITRVMGFFKTSLIVFMRNSIHMLANFQSDFLQAQQRMLTAKLGSVGKRMPLQTGADIIFLSNPTGFYRLTEIIEEQITANPIPISRKIQPIIDEIKWPLQAKWGCSELLGDYSYFGLVLNRPGANMCNAIAVLNHVTNEWESVDTWDNPAFKFNNLLTTNYNDTRRLFAVTPTAVYLLYESWYDHFDTGLSVIKSRMGFRGYACNDALGFKNFQRAVIAVKSFFPNATVTAVSDGIEEREELGVITKNYLGSYLHGRVDAPPDEALGNYVGQDFELLPDGPIALLPATAPQTLDPTEPLREDYFPSIGVKQESLERFEIRQTGRWVSIEIENVQGECDVIALGVEAVPIHETVRVQV